ncbi:MAG: hypothetical protein ACWGN1_06190, partial [Desulfobulbales bacterium]
MNRTEHPDYTPNMWFENRKEFFVRQLIEEFFLLNRSFQEIYMIYLECRNPGKWDCSDLLEHKSAVRRADIWNRLAYMVGTDSKKGLLWRLKDLCHNVWPENDNEHDVSGSLFDWLIGS